MARREAAPAFIPDAPVCVVSVVLAVLTGSNEVLGSRDPPPIRTVFVDKSTSKVVVRRSYRRRRQRLCLGRRDPSKNRDSRAGHRLLSEPTRLERQRRRPGDSPADARGPRSSRRLVARPAEGASRGDTDRRPGAALRRRATPRRAVKEGRRIVGNRLCERAEDSSRIDVCGLVWRRKHRWRPPIGTDLSFSPNRVDHSRRVRSGLAIPVGRARQPREIREIPVGIGGDDGAPRRDSARASPSVVVVFPLPPFPPATAITEQSGAQSLIKTGWRSKPNDETEAKRLSLDSSRRPRRRSRPRVAPRWPRSRLRGCRSDPPVHRGTRS